MCSVQCPRHEIARDARHMRHDGSGSTKAGPLRDFNSDEGFKAALDQSIDAATAESGRANLGAVGNHLLKLLPDFDPRNYGFRKLSDLVEKNPSLRLVREKTAHGTQVLYAERK
jgi:hypothetical protein